MSSWSLLSFSNISKNALMTVLAVFLLFSALSSRRCLCWPSSAAKNDLIVSATPLLICWPPIKIILISENNKDMAYFQHFQFWKRWYLEQFPGWPAVFALLGLHSKWRSCSTSLCCRHASGHCLKRSFLLRKIRPMGLSYYCLTFDLIL